MALELPEPIAAYFAADRGHDAEAVARCFAEDGFVKDEGRLHAGRNAIAHWKAEASTKFSYSVEPFAIESDGRRTVVSSHLVGNFPGSPTDLRYAFVLAGGKIDALEIIL